MKTTIFNLSCVLSRCSRFIGAMMVAALMVPAVAFSQSQTYANPSVVPLGLASTFGALAYSGITTDGVYTVNGDVGSSIASVSTNITAGAGGTKYIVGDPRVIDAQTALVTALTNANDHAARPTDFTIAANLNGLTLYKGIYDGGALDLANTGALTLNGGPTDVFIIRASSTLTINTGSSVNLIGGAVWSNVFWYVGTSANIFGGTTFNGIVLAKESIILTPSPTSVNAQLLANTGAITVNSTVLPVELTSFTAALNNSAVELNWNTATEVNNYGFEVQRSETQNFNWSKIGFVPGSGMSNSPKNYSFADNKTVSGSKYAYRLKQIDKDNKYTYSNVIEVNAVGQMPNAFLLNQNYPNPFNPSTQIQFGVSKNTYATLTIFNALGEKVSTLFNGNAIAGQVYNVTFNSNNLTSGIYYYKLQTNEKNEVRKMILMK